MSHDTCKKAVRALDFAIHTQLKFSKGVERCDCAPRSAQGAIANHASQFIMSASLPLQAATNYL